MVTLDSVLLLEPRVHSRDLAKKVVKHLCLFTLLIFGQLIIEPIEPFRIGYCIPICISFNHLKTLQETIDPTVIVPDLLVHHVNLFGVMPENMLSNSGRLVLEKQDARPKRPPLP